ncbi:uncharacterized protein LOC103570352 [Microplitis demolitor]|uniref:uncharacterized protein LOC103570352 n=1 Tax=Microplitis demolitor TaxID=69319 RepID=UPI0006D52181|nr:uncharacterized protein LOC103570352 [Microplitis demolitor]
MLKNDKKQLYALVQWVGRNHDKTYTPSIPIEWIMDFDLQRYLTEKENLEESYIVLWRQGKIETWKNYDAYVIEVSHSCKNLEREIVRLEGIVSPLKVKRNGQNNFVPKRAKKSATDSTNKRTLENDYDTESEIISLIQVHTKKPKIVKENRKKDCSSVKKNNNSYDKSSCSDNHDIFIEDDDNDTDFITMSKKVLKDNQQIKDGLNLLFNEIQEIKVAQNELKRDDGKARNPNNAENEQVEIGHPGSNVHVTRQHYETANSRDNFIKMTISLINALFSKETLIQSNCYGEKSRIQKDAPTRPGLNPINIDAVKDTVKSKFPREYKRGLFGMAINDYLNDLRRLQKQFNIIDDGDNVNDNKSNDGDSS